MKLCRRLIVSRTMSNFIKNPTLSAGSEKDFENYVGISTYVSHSAGFQGILKQRFSDFVVREITAGGVVTSLESTKLSSSIEAIEDKYFKLSDTGVEDIDKVLATIKSLDQVKFRASDEEIKAFLEMCINKIPECPASFTIGSCEDKKQRGLVHGAIRESYAATVDSDTFDDEVSKSNIRLISKHIQKKDHRTNMKNEAADAASGRGGGRGGRGGERGGRGKSGDKNKIGIDIRRQAWPAELGEFVQFTLSKENVDSLSAIQIIGKNLQMNQNNIGFAGTKDKRAVTYQKCTVYKRKPSNLLRINNIDRTPIIRIGDFQFVKKPLTLGDLEGNQFELILRDISGVGIEGPDPHHIKLNRLLEEACRNMDQYGFINYFGLQRFGKGVTHSHITGLAIIKSEWKKVIDCFFEEHGEFTSCRRVRDKSVPLGRPKNEVEQMGAAYSAGNFAAALEMCSSKMFSERVILQSLIAHPNEYRRAYDGISRGIRFLCVHAYQSYLWNKVASYRIDLSPHECMVGDLVVVAGEHLLDNGDRDCDDDDAELSGPIGTTVAAKDKAAGCSSSTAPAPRDVSMVVTHTLTAEDIANGTYSMKDVVVPVIGNEVEIPPLLHGIYSDLLAKDGLTLVSFNNNVLGLKGTYRKLIQRPKMFKYEILQYTDPNAELHETELPRFCENIMNDRKNYYGPGDKNTTSVVKFNTSGSATEPLEAKPEMSTTTETTMTASTAVTTATSSENEYRTYVGLKLIFSLSSGTYATMLLREMMKTSTETTYHASLTANNNPTPVQEQSVAVSNDNSASSTISGSAEEHECKRARVE